MKKKQLLSYPLIAKIFTFSPYWKACKISILYPLETKKITGYGLTNTQAVEEAFKLLKLTK